MLAPANYGGPVASLSFILWLIVLISFAPSAWRYVREYNLIDAYRTGIFFMAALWVGGLGRLLFIPDVEDVRVAVLAMSCALAVYLLILARQGAIR